MSEPQDETGSRAGGGANEQPPERSGVLRSKVADTGRKMAVID